MARYCGTLTKKKYAMGGQAPDPFGGNPQGNALYDPQGAKNQTIDNVGTGVASYFGPWWGALAKAGTTTSSLVKGDETNQTRSQAGQLADPFNQFKNNKTGADWLLSFGNPFRSALTKGTQRVKDIQTAKAAQVTARNKAFGPAASAGLNQMFTGDQASGAPQFAKGGPMADKPTVIKGGHLKPVGESVEVKGNKPSIKDGVETPTAKLDDGEMIDSKNRVYSDRIRHHDGRSMAEHAKAIEHRRSVNPQADQDLDDLFTYQEAQKPTTMKFNSNPPPSKAYQKSTAITVAPAGAKQHLAGGGELDPGKRLKLRTGSAAASARPSVNGTTITADELKRIQAQPDRVKIPFRTREKIVPVKDRVNPLRKPGFAQGGKMDPAPKYDKFGNKITIGVQRTRVGTILPTKDPVKFDAGQSLVHRGPDTKPGTPVKIKNFSRSGYR